MKMVKHASSVASSAGRVRADPCLLWRFKLHDSPALGPPCILGRHDISKRSLTSRRSKRLFHLAIEAFHIQPPVNTAVSTARQDSCRAHRCRLASRWRIRRSPHHGICLSASASCKTTPSCQRSSACLQEDVPESAGLQEVAAKSFFVAQQRSNSVID